MAADFEHRPVLRDEVIEAMVANEPATVVDCTLGGGGHAHAICSALPSARLIGFDRDPSAIAAATERLSPFAERVRLIHAPFGELAPALVERGLGRVDAILADLGVSSHQLDTADRGFSFRGDGPLDMRMNPTADTPVSELVATMSESDLADVIYQYGEERHSRRVARAICADKPQTTLELAELVRRVVPKSKDGLDPSTRTFQALRMLANDELGQLRTLLDAIPEVLNDGGLAAIISFHSLEDRAVKRAFRAASGRENPSRHAPQLPTTQEATLEVLSKRPIVATDDEKRENTRSRSAKLRLARRLPR